jgi:hypothetical protein
LFNLQLKDIHISGGLSYLAPLNMTGGFGGLHIAEEGGEDASQEWSGSARIMGPIWARFATLTVGLLGLQVFWSVEMSYGACNCGRWLQTCLIRRGSIAISALFGTHKISHGSGLPCGASLWTYCSAPRRFVFQRGTTDMAAKRSVEQVSSPTTPNPASAAEDRI